MFHTRSGITKYVNNKICIGGLIHVFYQCLVYDSTKRVFPNQNDDDDDSNKWNKNVITMSTNKL